MDIKNFWEEAHSKNETLWLTNSKPEEVYKVHNFPVSSGRMILEVGVGTGDSIKAHVKRNNFVVAVDISQEALNKVADISHTYLTSNMPNIKNDFVDYALCHLVFQHCNDDMVKFIIENVLRTLKKDGIFYFQFADIPEANVEFNNNYRFAIDNDIMHFRTASEMGEIVEKCKGEVVSISPPKVWKEEYNITWYMMQIKRK